MPARRAGALRRRHKRDAFLTETFGRFVEWVPVCPEVECGFGTPREAVRLVRIEQELRLLTVNTGIDLTEQMKRFSRSRIGAGRRRSVRLREPHPKELMLRNHI